MRSERTAWESNPVNDSDPVVNKLLCFISNKINTMPVDMILKLCYDFYDASVVEASKRTLFRILEENGERLPRYMKRIGPSKKTNDTRDIIELLLALDPVNIPIFVARDLANLPPLSYNNFDISKILKDVEELKCNMKALQVISSTQQDIMSAVKYIKESTNLSAGVQEIKQDVTDSTSPNSHEIPSIFDSEVINASADSKEIITITDSSIVNEASAGECPADEVVTNREMEDLSDLIRLADIQQEGKPYHRQSYAE